MPPLHVPLRGNEPSWFLPGDDFGFYSDKEELEKMQSIKVVWRG